jgi:hypothetical protein
MVFRERPSLQSALSSWRWAVLQHCLPSNFHTSWFSAPLQSVSFCTCELFQTLAQERGAVAIIVFDYGHFSGRNYDTGSFAVNTHPRHAVTHADEFGPQKQSTAQSGTKKHFFFRSEPVTATHPLTHTGQSKTKRTSAAAPFSTISAFSRHLTWYFFEHIWQATIFPGAPFLDSRR